jgi:hypothetical protein
MLESGLIVSILKVLAVVAVGFPALIYLFQDRLIFHPQPLADVHRGELATRYPAVRELVLGTEDGGRLHAWHVPARGPAPLVIYFGGNAEEVSWMIPEVMQRTPAISWLLVDYRGYGSSDGAPSEAALGADALAWYDRISMLEGVDAKRIFVFGRSLGSGVAVHLASQRPVAGVVLVTPFDSLLSVAQRYYPYLPVNFMLKHRFDSLGRAPELRMPLLCLAAMQDEVIPPEHARRLYDAWGGRKQWVELDGASHNTTDSQANYWPAIVAFLSSP